MPPQFRDGEELVEDLVGGVLDEKDPPGLRIPSVFGVEKVAFIGRQNARVLRPDEGNVLDDDLTADAEFLRQHCTGQGAVLVFQHL